MFKLFYSIFISAFIMSSCNGQNPAVKNLNADEFESGIQNKNILLLDVRTPEEYVEKRIKNSINININDTSFEKQLNTLDKSKPLYIYCLAGSRSAKAAEVANKIGFSKVYNLRGGIMAWTASKKPVIAEGGATPESGMSFDDYLNRIKKSNKLVLVDFNAVWCGPCKVLKPIVQKVIKKNSDKVELFDVDVDKNTAVANTMNINAIPLIILYKQGKEVWRNLGLAEEELLTEKIKQFAD